MKPTKVLIVDGEPGSRDALGPILHDWGYDVNLAANGTEGKQIAAVYGPDIVVSDTLELLRCLKSENPRLPVILATAHASIDLAVESMKQGAHDFITKPIDYPRFRSILKSAESAIEVASATLLLPLGITAAAAERELILRTLERTGNNKTEAARQLGLDVKTIRTKLKTYGTRQTQNAV